MELALIWSIPRMLLSVRSRTYSSWLLPCSEAAPSGPPSVHCWAGRGEFPLICRPVAGEAWQFTDPLPAPPPRRVFGQPCKQSPLAMLALEQPDSRQSMEQSRRWNGSPFILRTSRSQCRGEDAGTWVNRSERGQKAEGMEPSCQPSPWTARLPWSGRKHTLRMLVSGLSETPCPE